jgi:hypothetical protein
MNVAESKELILKLGLDKVVYWMPMMKRKEIMFGLSLSDVSCGQFDSSWLTCGVVNETLALGVPLLHFRDDNLYLKDYPNLYPILNCNSRKELCQRLQDYSANPSFFKENAKKGKAWLDEYSVEKPLSIIFDSMLNLGSKNNNFKSNSKVGIIKVQLKMQLLFAKFSSTFFS